MFKDFKKLGKKEQAHFKFATHGVMTLQAFKENRQAQKVLQDQDTVFNHRETCPDCQRIAVKLGLETWNCNTMGATLQAQNLNISRGQQEIIK